mgnify:CR=1 FL=1
MLASSGSVRASLMARESIFRSEVTASSEVDGGATSGSSGVSQASSAHERLGSGWSETVAVGVAVAVSIAPAIEVRERTMSQTRERERERGLAAVKRD